MEQKKKERLCVPFSFAPSELENFAGKVPAMLTKLKHNTHLDVLRLGEVLSSIKKGTLLRSF